MNIATSLTQSRGAAEKCAEPRFLNGAYASARVDPLCASAPLREPAFAFLSVSLS